MRLPRLVVPAAFTAAAVIVTLLVWQSRAQASRYQELVLRTPTDVFAISHDAPDVSAAYARANRISYELLTWSDRSHRELYRARDVPLTLVIGDDGRIVYARAGRLDNAPAAVDTVRSVLRMPAPPSAR